MPSSDSFRPMLASHADLDKLKYPLLASPKLDGVRAIVRGGQVLSRSLKPIPNEWVQTLFSGLEHCDGELIVGAPTSKTCYTDTVSGVMRASGKPDVRFYMFDHVHYGNDPYLKRVGKLTGENHMNWEFLHQRPVHTPEELLDFEHLCLTEGYEGLILRDPQGRYKFGRSTAKEGLLLKLKRFQDSEAEILGYEEEQFNGNAAETNELGRTKRSSHKAGKSGKGTLGALLVRDCTSGVDFSIGTGLTADERQHIWDRQNDYRGKLVKYKFFPVGVKERPRHPVYLGMRDARDMS